MMKLRTKYIVFVGIVHLVTLVLSYFIFRQNGLLFIVAEILIILSLCIAWRLYHQLIQPLRSLMEGVNTIRDKDFTVKFLPTGKYEMDQLIDVYNRMIDELRTERTRQEQQHFFLEKLILTSPTGIIILDYENQVQQVNPKAAQILSIDNNNSPDDILLLIKTMRSGETKTIKLNGIHTYKIQKSHFIDRGFSRHFIMLEDLTSEILAAEKNVYGKVIRMIAHEVNNTIGPVNSIIQSTLNTSAIWADPPASDSPSDQAADSLKEALQAALDRNQNLNLFVRNFADLVKLPAPNKKPLDLHQLLQGLSSIMTITAKEKGISLACHLAPTPFPVLADEPQIEQALINILKNAIEAIEDNGQVTITTDP